MALYYHSSSFWSQTFPIIWGRPTTDQFFLLHPALFAGRPMSAQQSSCRSCTHPSTLDLASLIFSFMEFPQLAPHCLRRFSAIFSDICNTLFVTLCCSFLILSFCVTPHIEQDIYLSILISFTYSHASCPFPVVQATAPYSIYYCCRDITYFRNNRRQWKYFDDSISTTQIRFGARRKYYVKTCRHLAVRRRLTSTVMAYFVLRS